jgi:hypothetical protein
MPKRYKSGSLERNLTKVYWEAYRVHQGDTTYQRRKQRKTRFTDRASYALPGGHTCGVYLQDGIIKFFCIDPNDPAANGVGTGELGDDLPSADPSWGVGRVVEAGPLPSTATMPAWWGRPEIDGPAARSFYNWWCCCNTKNDFFESTASPTMRAP